MASTKTVPIKKTDICLPNQQQKLAFTLDNVLTEEECKEYISRTEKKGYEQAMVNIGGGRQMLATHIRNSSRCIWDTKEHAQLLWKRIQKYIPEYWKGHKALGLNERLRFLRYDPGEYFKPHYDGSYIRDNGESSFITVQLYLNEGFEGGSTTFLGWNDEDEVVPCVPKIGRVLIFQHDIYHEGSVLLKGRKYAMRTDIMFTKETFSVEQQMAKLSLETQQTDREAYEAAGALSNE